MARFQIERILTIDRLIREHRYPSAESIAARYDVSRRVVFEDRKFLVERLGAPLEFDRARRGWYYTEPSWALPATVITEGELLAFFLSVEVAQRNLGGALDEPLRSAIAKLAHTLPDKIEVQLGQLGRHYSFAEPAHAATDPAVLAALHGAIAAQRVVSIVYFTASTGRRKSRQVHPHHLYHAHGDWYLVAFDVSRAAMLNFHVGRIQSHEVRAERFRRAADFDGAAWVRASFVTETDGPAREIAIRFDEYQARYVRERRFHETQTLEEQPDGGVLLRFQSSGLGEIQRWVLGYGAHAEVLAPPDLRDRVAQEIQRMARLYKGTK